MKISLNKKKEGKFCCAYGCNNKPIYKKGGLCHKHYARKMREENPKYMRYNQWKSSAIQRGKDFTVTWEGFKEICEETGYMIKKGMRGRNATLDRIENHLGYHKSNIQILTMKANVNKYHTEDKFADVPF
ncbi:MAG: hypothetical protein ACM31G_07130 [Flavobacteriales bacterium]